MDPKLQAIAFEELKKGVELSKAKGGWAAMMDPHTGELLAAVQIKDSSLENMDFISSPFLPASAFKPLPLAVCLKANQLSNFTLFSPEERVSVAPCVFPGRPYPLKDMDRHKELNLKMAMSRSSNVYIAKIVQRTVDAFGEKWFREELRTIFGLGEKTGQEFPLEAVGVLPDPNKGPTKDFSGWNLCTSSRIAYGHNLLVTGLQMLQSFAVFANGGFKVAPTLTNAQAGGPRVLDESICRQIVQLLKFVTKPGGTAEVADIPGYTEAGKTGTAELLVDYQYLKGRYSSYFVGIAPTSAPRFVLMINIQEPETGLDKRHTGGHCAAPIFSAIGKRALDYLQVPKDDPFGDPDSPNFSKKNADMIKESAELFDLYFRWNYR